MAQKRSVEFDTYNVICKLTDSMKMCLTKMSNPVAREVRVGYASMRQIFFQASKAARQCGRKQELSISLHRF
jgi:translation initiation factor IF-2